MYLPNRYGKRPARLKPLLAVIYLENRSCQGKRAEHICPENIRWDHEKIQETTEVLFNEFRSMFFNIMEEEKCVRPKFVHFFDLLPE